MQKKRIVIIPVNNVANNISKIINDLKFEIPSIHYVIIDDGSTDKTLQICKEKHFNVISLENKVGLHKAIQTGYKFAIRHSYDYVIRYDGSGSYNPKDITKLENNIEDMFDMIIGNRFKNTRPPLSINILSKLIYQKNKKTIYDPETGLSVITTKIAKNLMEVKGEYLNAPFLVEQLKEGYTLKELDIEYINNKNQYYKKMSLFKAFTTIMIHKLFRPFKKNKVKGH